MSVSFTASDGQHLSIAEFNTENTTFVGPGFYPNTLILLPNNTSTLALELRDRPPEEDQAKANERCWKYNDPSTWGFEFSVNGTAVVDTWMTDTSETAHCTFGDWVETVYWGWDGQGDGEEQEEYGKVWIGIDDGAGIGDPVLVGEVTKWSRDVDCYYPCVN